MEIPNRETIKEVVRKHFLKSYYRGYQRWGKVWDEVIPEILPSPRPPYPEEEALLRVEIWRSVDAIIQEVALEEEDEFAIALEMAMSELRKSDVLEVCRKSWESYLAYLKKEIVSGLRPGRQQGKRFGPKSWSPTSAAASKARIDRLVQEELEREDTGLVLVIQFDKYGGLSHWMIEGKGLRTQRSQPYAVVEIGPKLDWSDVRYEVIEALKSVDWREVEGHAT